MFGKDSAKEESITRRGPRVECRTCIEAWDKLQQSKFSRTNYPFPPYAVEMSFGERAKAAYVCSKKRTAAKRKKASTTTSSTAKQSTARPSRTQPTDDSDSGLSDPNQSDPGSDNESERPHKKRSSKTVKKKKKSTTRILVGLLAIAVGH
ncbi:hypothetical protein BDP27DRAFT_1481960 [Rhodocollybia butyracea]|uniref:Uncharacterized protein n=1 Tax=Rhodocollybia butyracea TaxID=206335 RepID=A0A9P5U1L9_9AGAR|nr:hypothetical protein BDP27DRAFT_1481960 [Rhodocollybia butyracea]